jgi:hypothetical protein
MKHVATAAAILIVLSPFVLARVGEAVTYEWTDEAGVVHFTDDKDKIPAKFLKRVKELNIGSDQNVISPSAPAQENTPLAAPPEKKGTILSEGYWRSKFTNLRRDIKALEDSLPAMKEQEAVLSRKRIIYGRTSDRIARENMVQSKPRLKKKSRGCRKNLKPSIRMLLMQVFLPSGGNEG